MKKVLLTTMFCAGLVAAVEAAPTDVVTQADLQALRALIEQQNAKIEAQAKRIAELEGRQAAAKPAAEAEAPKIAPSEDTTTNETGRIWTLGDGSKFYLADATSGIFQPLSESGLRITPYGYLTFEAVHNTHKTETDIYTDWVLPRRNGRKNGDHQTVFSMNDSIIGFNFDTPETYQGWKFNGKFEFDLAGSHANDPDFHFRHLYFAMDNEESGWNILFGQTWHLWKMVTPQEIDGAWMENTGYPYRRSPQIRVTKRFAWEDSSLEFRAGLVKNGNGMGGDRDDDYNQDNTASAWGLVEGAIVYDHKALWEDSDRRWLVGLGGMYGRDKSHRFWYDAEEDEFTGYGKSDEYDTDLIMVAGSLPFFEKTRLPFPSLSVFRSAAVTENAIQAFSSPEAFSSRASPLNSALSIQRVSFSLSSFSRTYSPALTSFSSLLSASSSGRRSPRIIRFSVLSFPLIFFAMDSLICTSSGRV